MKLLGPVSLTDSVYNASLNKSLSALANATGCCGFFSAVLD
jgi:hypothetical protein